MDTAAKPFAEREDKRVVPLHRMKLFARTLRLWEVGRQVASWSLETGQGLREGRCWAPMRAVRTRADLQMSGHCIIAMGR